MKAQQQPKDEAGDDLVSIDSLLKHFNNLQTSSIFTFAHPSCTKAASQSGAASTQKTRKTLCLWWPLDFLEQEEPQLEPAGP